MNKKLDIDFYRPGKADFIASMKRRSTNNKWESFNNDISLYCACFGLPVLVAVTFAEEALENGEFPFSDVLEFKSQLNEKKKVVKEFYGYD